MRLFGNGKGRDFGQEIGDLKVKVMTLEADLSAMRRDLVDVDQTVRRWAQRDKMRERRSDDDAARVGGEDEPGTSEPASVTPPHRNQWGARGRKERRLQQNGS